MSDLKPCPFCGSGVARTVGNAGFSGVELMGAGTDRPFVWCGTCGSAGSSEDSDCKAIAAWNRRAIPAVQPTVSPDVAALVETLDKIEAAQRDTGQEFPTAAWLEFRAAIARVKGVM